MLDDRTDTPLVRGEFRTISRRRSVTSLGRKVVLIAVFALVLEHLGLSGVFFPVVVTSGSMLPTLFGPYWSGICPRCGERLDWDATTSEKASVLSRAVCSSCGKRWIEVAGHESARSGPVGLHPGEHIFVCRGLIRPIRRWDLVAVRMRDLPGVVVKRVVGLPGERIAVRQGVLESGDNLLPRPLKVQQQMGRLLWRLSRENQAGLVLESGEEHGDSAKEWHFSWDVTSFCYFHPAMDQMEQPCSNILWELSLSHEGQPARFIMSANCGGQKIVLEWTLDRDGTLNWRVDDPQELAEARGVNHLSGNWPRTVLLSSVDRQWLLSVDHREVFRWNCPQEPPLGSGRVSLSVRVEKGRLRLHDVRVWSVLPYPDGLIADRGDGYVLMGDDPHVSRDSREGGRRWEADNIVGVVWPVYWFLGRTAK